MQLVEEQDLARQPPEAQQDAGGGGRQ